MALAAQDYKKIIEDLRGKFVAYDVTGNHNSAQLYKNAADAIDELQADVKQAAKRNAELHAELEKWVSAAEELQDTVQAQDKALKECARQLAKTVPKRGEWIDNDARRVTARCSVCGHLRLGNGAEWANKHVHFCEACGSRMGDEKA